MQFNLVARHLAVAVVGLGALVSSAGAQGVDTTPPRITRISPAPQGGFISGVGLSTIEIDFSEPVTAQAAHFALLDDTDAAIAFSLETDPENAAQVRLVLAGARSEGRATLIVEYGIADAAGNRLDGEIGEPGSPSFPTGDGVAGGQAVVRYDLFGSDYNRDRQFDSQDYFDFLEDFFSIEPSADVNGDGFVDSQDFFDFLDLLIRVLGGETNPPPPTDGVRPMVLSFAPDASAPLSAPLSQVLITFDEPVRATRVRPGALYAITSAGLIRAATSAESVGNGAAARFHFSPALTRCDRYTLRLCNSLVDDSGESLSAPAPVEVSGLVPLEAPTLDPYEGVTSAGFMFLSGAAPGAARVEVTTVEGVLNLNTPDGTFSGPFPLGSNRLNVLYFTAVSSCGVRSAPTTARIISDQQPPSLHIDFPADGAQIQADRTDVAGRVGDELSGYLGLTVLVNGQAATVDEGIGANGTFVLPNFLLNNSGPTVIQAVATDGVGNTVSRSISVSKLVIPPNSARMEIVSGNGQAGMIQMPLIAPLQIRMLQGNGAPFVNKVVTFTVTRSDGRLNAEYGPPGDRLFQTHTDAGGYASAYWTLGTDAGRGNNRVEVISRDIAGTIVFCASAMPGPAAQINVGSGNNQRAEAGAPAPEPLIAWVSDSCNGIEGVNVTFTVEEGGGLVNGLSIVTVPTSRTGHAQVEYTLGPERGNQTVVANFPGNQTSPATFVTYALVRDPAKPTSLAGLVLDNASQPIQNATCTLLVNGRMAGQTMSSRDGQFHFDSIGDSGDADLMVNGLTATHVGGEGPGAADVPAGSYPLLRYDLTIVPNAQNGLPKPVLLPPLDPANARAYSTTQDTVLTVQGVEGLRMIVRAGSMRMPPLIPGTVGAPAPNGTIISLNQVHHDDVPMPMPDGAAPLFAWTLQPGGATFDPPITIEYPNMSALMPGAIANFLSFNHDTSRFEIVSSGHVVEDGSLIVTDAGSGLSRAGWGCNCPPYSVTGECRDCTPQANGCGPEWGGGGNVLTDCMVYASESCPTVCFTPSCNSHDVCWGSCHSSPNCSLTRVSCDEQFHADLLAQCSDCFEPDTLIYAACAARAWIYAQLVSGFTGNRAYNNAQDEACACCDTCDCEGGHVGLRGSPEPPYADADADLLPDEWEVRVGLDPSDAGDAMIDIDGDRVLNVMEFVHSLDPLNPDSDGDGLSDRGEIDASQPPPPITVDGSWTLSVAGQHIQARPLGTFSLGNVTAADAFGEGGPGSTPDFLSDDFVRVTGSATIGGRTRYAFSDRFQIRPGESYIVDITTSDSPAPSPRSLEIVAAPTVLMPGQTAQATVTGTMEEGSQVDLTQRTDWTTYRTSNPRVAGVGRDGLITGRSRGTVFITAANDAAAAIKRIEVATSTVVTTLQGIVRLQDGTPVEGAEITSEPFGGSALSDGGGAFSLTLEVPATASTLAVRADSVVGGQSHLGRSAGVAIVADAVSDCGLVIVRPVQTGGLFPGLQVDVGTRPHSVAIGDLDSDGDADLAVANLVSLSVSILLNNGDGTFAARVNYGVGTNPVSVALGDLDQDGDADLAVANSFSNTVSVLLNDGDGGFGASASYGTGANPFSVAIGDLDSDGDADLAVANERSNTVSVLLNNGNGTYAPHVGYAAGFGPISVAMGDLDSDGDTDLAVANFIGSGTVSVLMNTGAAVFGAPVSYGVGSSPRSVAIGDLDSDGDGDLAVANWSSSDVSVLLNGGNGTFAARINYGADDDPFSVAIGDVDSDGDADMAVANQGASTVTILRNNGDGAFGAGVNYVVSTPVAVAIGDIDSDGDADLALANTTSASVCALLNHGDGTFAASMNYGAGTDSYSVVIGDLDSDGDADLAVTNYISIGSVSVLLNNGDGTYATSVNYAAGAFPNGLATGDLDADGDADLAVTNANSPNICVLLNNGNGTFAARVNYATAPSPNAVAIGDLDSDGDADLAVANYTNPGAVSILLNHGNGDFAASVNYTVWRTPTSVAIGDVDSDGDADLAVATDNSMVVAVLLNNGNGTFAAGVHYTAGNRPFAVAIGDLDSDGDADLAVANYDSASVSVLYNNGNGVFSASVHYAVGTNPYSVAMGDLDLDGDADLAVANANSANVSVLLNHGNGVFAARVNYAAGSRPYSVAIGDLDSDGDADLAVANRMTPKVTVLLNMMVESGGLRGAPAASLMRDLPQTHDGDGSGSRSAHGSVAEPQPGNRFGPPSLELPGPGGRELRPAKLSIRRMKQVMDERETVQTPGASGAALPGGGSFPLSEVERSRVGTPVPLARDDQGRIIGHDQTDLGDQHAFFWTQEIGLIDLNDFLAPNSGWILTVAESFDGDGAITGRGTLDGRETGFRLEIDWEAVEKLSARAEGSYVGDSDSHFENSQGLSAKGASPDFDGNGVVESEDFFRFLEAFFAGDRRADFDGSGEVDSGDYFGYLECYLRDCG